MTKASFKARRKWILNDNPSVTEVLEKYCVLKKQVYVSIASYHLKHIYYYNAFCS